MALDPIFEPQVRYWQGVYHKQQSELEGWLLSLYPGERRPCRMAGWAQIANRADRDGISMPADICEALSMAIEFRQKAADYFNNLSRVATETVVKNHEHPIEVLQQIRAIFGDPSVSASSPTTPTRSETARSSWPSFPSRDGSEASGLPCQPRERRSLDVLALKSWRRDPEPSTPTRDRGRRSSEPTTTPLFPKGPASANSRAEAIRQISWR
jgi:hypothetical protein